MLSHRGNLLVVVVFVSSLFLVAASSGTPPQQVANSWGWPLGSDGYSYIVRHNVKYGTTVENTDYSIRNLDLTIGIDHITCFGVGAHRIYHAGVDLYRVGASAAGAEVRAVANGVVVSKAEGYPGFVLLVRHTLPGGGYLYSLYGHLGYALVDVGDHVAKGQTIGYVATLPYAGRFPEFHPDGDDSHLHFEIRGFYDASALFPQCSAAGVFGPGYTYPNLPSTYDYYHPLLFIQNQQTWAQAAYLPAVVRDYLPPPTCQEGQDLLQNGGFESGSIEDPYPWLEITTAFDLPFYHIVQEYLVFSGQRSARLGGWDVGRIVSEELPQSFVVPLGISSGEWEQVVRIYTDEVSPNPEDIFNLTLNDAHTGLNLLEGGGIYLDNTTPCQDYWCLLEITIPNLYVISGRAVSVSYSGLSNEALATSLFVDDAHFVAHCGGVQRYGEYIPPLSWQVSVQPVDGPSLPARGHGR